MGQGGNTSTGSRPCAGSRRSEAAHNRTVCEAPASRARTATQQRQDWAAACRRRVPAADQRDGGPRVHYGGLIDGVACTSGARRQKEGGVGDLPFSLGEEKGRSCGVSMPWRGEAVQDVRQWRCHHSSAGSVMNYGDGVPASLFSFLYFSSSPALLLHWLSRQNRGNPPRGSSVSSVAL